MSRVCRNGIPTQQSSLSNDRFSAVASRATRQQRFAAMKFLKQWYLQRAIQEKARGDFAEAAKYYAKAEQYEAVGAMYEMLGEVSQSLPEKIQAYQQALHWYVACNAPARAELAGKLAALMEDDVREDGQIKRAERHTLQQIA